MTAGLTILIVGGYGTFGGRIVQLLKDEKRLTLIVAGRARQKADDFCDRHRDAQARLVPATFDRGGEVRAQIAALRPDVLVDASGPFQDYGAAPYRVIDACLAERVNYLDLADGSGFVAGVRAFDAPARAAGLFALSGVSSFPVLTAAVVRRLSDDMARVDRICGGIAPSPYAGVGANVIRATAAYAGQPIRLTKNGRLATGHPFTEHMRVTIAPPGKIPLRNTLFSLVDVPDLGALAELWPDAATIWMGAGPVPEALHRALTALAWLVRIGLVPSLAPLAPVMHVATNRLRWGEHRSGMFVDVEGADGFGVPLRRSWHLLAEGDDGPLIPSMAVQAIVRRMLDGTAPAPGARAAVRELELGDYDALFADRTIHTGFRDDRPTEAVPLFARILGSAWDDLPSPVRAMHAIDGGCIAEGRARVERGTGWLTGLIGRVMGFPDATPDTPLEVRFGVTDGVETWTRVFGQTTLGSQLYAGSGRSDRLLCERFGPLRFAMALVFDGARLWFVVRRWSVFGVPMPPFLGPRTKASESIEDGRFHFDVAISHPFTGLIVRYRGWLAPPTTRGEAS